MSFNFITAAEAASYIKDGDIVGLSGFTPCRKSEGCDCRVSKKQKKKTRKGRIFSQIGLITGAFDGRFVTDADTCTCH